MSYNSLGLSKWRTLDILEEIAAERQRQDAKWGEQNHPDGTGPRDAGGRSFLHRMMAHSHDPIATNAGLRDGFRDACDLAHRAGVGTWLDILLEEVAEAAAEDDPATLRIELIQVAAVAAAWIDHIDRRDVS